MGPRSAKDKKCPGQKRDRQRRNQGGAKLGCSMKAGPAGQPGHKARSWGRTRVRVEQDNSVGASTYPGHNQMEVRCEAGTDCEESAGMRVMQRPWQGSAMAGMTRQDKLG